MIRELNIEERQDVVDEVAHQIANIIRAEPFEPDSFVAKVTPILKKFGESATRYGKNLARRSRAQIANAEEGKRELGSSVFNLLRGHILELEIRISNLKKMPVEKLESTSFQRTIRKSEGRIAQYKLAIALLTPIAELELDPIIEDGIPATQLEWII
jgi:hypothetical protein